MLFKFKLVVDVVTVHFSLLQSGFGELVPALKSHFFMPDVDFWLDGIPSNPEHGCAENVSGVISFDFVLQIA